MELLKSTPARWLIGIVVVLGIANVIARPSPDAIYPTTNIEVIFDLRKAEIAKAISDGAPQPEPIPLPDAPPIDMPAQTPIAIDGAEDPSEVGNPGARATEAVRNTEETIPRGFMLYTPGMKIRSPEELRESLHTIIHYKQPVYEAVLQLDAEQEQAALAYLDNLVSPTNGAYPLEFVSNFYADVTYTQTRTEDGIRVLVELQYAPQTEETKYVDTEEQKIIESIITDDMTELQKVRAIHDWLVLNLEYDTELTRFYQYEALRDRKTVCQGYALLAYDLLERAGVRAYVVTGDVHPEQAVGTPEEQRGHAWNMVRVDGMWYHLDVTWDDPVPDQPGVVQNDYFLVSDRVIAASRQFDQDTTVMLRPTAAAVFVDN